MVLHAPWRFNGQDHLVYSDTNQWWYTIVTPFPLFLDCHPFPQLFSPPAPPSPIAATVTLSAVSSIIAPCCLCLCCGFFPAAHRSYHRDKGFPGRCLLHIWVRINAYDCCRRSTVSRRSWTMWSSVFFAWGCSTGGRLRPGAAMTAAGTTPTLATRWWLEWNKFFVLQDQNLSEKGRRRKTNDEVVEVMGQGVGC